MNEFISGTGPAQYSRTFKIRNVFGWFGLPFLALGLLGLAGWPVSILRYRKQ
jgi:hypothetical protein